MTFLAMEDETTVTTVSAETFTDSAKEVEQELLDVENSGKEDDQEAEHVEIELVDEKGAVDNLSAEDENSGKKMKDLEADLSLVDSEARELEDLHKRSSSNAESEALELEKFLEISKSSANEGEDQMVLFQEEVKGLNQNLEDALSSTAAELARVQEELGVSQLLTSELVEKLSSKEASFSEIAQELARKEALESQLKEDISSLARRLDSAMENLNVKVFELDDIKLRLLEEASLRETVQSSLKAQEDHVTKVYGEMANLAKEKEELERKIVGLAATAASLEEKNADLEVRLTGSAEKFIEADALLSQALTNNAELEAKLKSLEALHTESEQISATATLKSIESEDAPSNGAAEEEANSQARELEMELNLGELKSAGVGKGDLENKFKSMEEELELQKKSLESFTLEKSELELSHSLFVHGLEIKLQEALQKLNDKHTEVRDLKQELDQALWRLAAMQSETMEYQRMIEKAGEKILQLSSDNEILVHTNMQLKIRVNEIEELLNSVCAEKDATAKKLLSDCEAQILNLEQQLRDITQKFIIRDTEANELLEKVRILEMQINSYEAQVHEASAALAEMNAESVVEELKAKLAESDNLKAQIDAKLKEKKEMEDDFVADLADGNAEGDEKSVLQAQIKELEDKLLAVEEEFKSEREAHSLKESELEASIKHSGDELDAKIAQFMLVEQQLKELNEKSKATEIKSRDFEAPIISKKSEAATSASTSEIHTGYAGLSPITTLKFMLGVALVSIIIGIILGKRY